MNHSSFLKLLTLGHPGCDHCSDSSNSQQSSIRGSRSKIQADLVMTMDPGEPIKIPSTTIAIDNESVSFTSESLIPRTFNVYRGSSLCS